jgi:hypothetical protein
VLCAERRTTAGTKHPDLLRGRTGREIVAAAWVLRKLRAEAAPAPAKTLRRPQVRERRMSSDRVPVLRGRCRGPAGPDTRIGANELGGTLDEASLLARLDLARVSAQEGQISEAIAEFQDVLALGQPGAAAYDRFARETSEQIGGAGARFLLALGQVGQAVALAELERSTNRCGSCAMPSRSARMTRNQSSNSSWRLRASLRRAWSRQAASREGHSGRDGRSRRTSQTAASSPHQVQVRRCRFRSRQARRRSRTAGFGICRDDP